MPWLLFKVEDLDAFHFSVSAFEKPTDPKKPKGAGFINIPVTDLSTFYFRTANDEQIRFEPPSGTTDANGVPVQKRSRADADENTAFSSSASPVLTDSQASQTQDADMSL